MKLIFSVLVGIILFAHSAYAEVSLAAKGGYRFFDKSADSQYEHNSVYANEWVSGGYLRLKDGPYFLRFDYDRGKTGNEFDNFSAIAYEGVHMSLNSLTLSAGFFPKSWLYIYGGAGVGLNELDVLAFDLHPIFVDPKPSLIWTVGVGIEKPLYKCLYGFLEVRRTWQEQEFRFTGSPSPGTSIIGNTSEDLSETGIFAGLGLSF